LSIGATSASALLLLTRANFDAKRAKKSKQPLNSSKKQVELYVVLAECNNIMDWIVHYVESRE